MVDVRLEQAKIWLSKQQQTSNFTIKPLAGDASFRRYFRVHTEQAEFVLMDAPPAKEDVTPFINTCLWLEDVGLNVPDLVVVDQHHGFLLLQDFGDTTWSIYFSKNSNIESLFKDALQQLFTLQNAEKVPQLPCFDISRMQTECNLYLDWYLPHIKSYTPTISERDQFHEVLSPLLKEIHEIPYAPVHLDYHSRNLMVPPSGLPLGVIDFQDAVHGPITYDLASLLYDCYQDYPENERRRWSEHFFNNLKPQHQKHFKDFEAWHRALRLTSLQRHIKVLGIFARLAYRDGKTQFLNEIPLTLKHFTDELESLSLKLPLLNT